MAKCRCCKKRASFNVLGETKGRFCADHRKTEMVDIKHKICETSGCNTIPNYNVRGETTGRFCATHKESQMVNVWYLKRATPKNVKKYPYITLVGKPRVVFAPSIVHPKWSMWYLKRAKPEGAIHNQATTLADKPKVVFVMNIVYPKWSMF